MTRDVYIPASFGEVLDKITILEIKAEKIEDAAKLGNIRRELDALQAVWSETFDKEPIEMSSLRLRLKDANCKLWIIEDEIRDCERRQDFGDAFVGFARSVYATNDERAAIKSEINRILGSPLREEKSYKPYRNNQSGGGPPSAVLESGKSDEASAVDRPSDP